MFGNERRHAFAKHMFLGEIEHQSRIASKAAKRLPRADSDFDELEVWSAIQSILTAAASVSRILWPSQKDRYPRGEMMRALLEIDEHNCLSDRDLRNHFEHYDERIDDWLIANNSEIYDDQVIGSLPEFLSQFPERANRSFDPTTQTVAFRGETLDLRVVMGALEEIRLKCQNIRQL